MKYYVLNCFFFQSLQFKLTWHSDLGQRAPGGWIYTVCLNWITTCSMIGGGHSTFFQVGVCGPDFRSVGLANWHLSLKKGGLWAENFQIWGLVSWKFPNLGACELKIPKFGGLWAGNFQIWGLWAKIWVKIEAVEAKISKFSQKGVLWTDSFAWNGTLASGRRKGGLQGRTSPYLFLGQCPLPRVWYTIQ